MFGYGYNPDPHKHEGKAMIKQINNTIEIVMECDTCGTFTVGPFDVCHTRSIAAMLDEAGERLGQEVGTRLEVETMQGNDPSIMEEGERRFAAMNKEEAERLLNEREAQEMDTETDVNAWDRRKRG